MGLESSGTQITFPISFVNKPFVIISSEVANVSYDNETNGWEKVCGYYWLSTTKSATIATRPSSVRYLCFLVIGY